MSLRSPLNQVIGRGSARNGVHHWWVQRVSAVALIPLAIWFMYEMVRLPLADYAAVTVFVSWGWHPIALTLLMLVAAYHSQLGVQVVIEDYVHTKGQKVIALLASSFTHGLLAVAGVYAVLRIALRS
ncbi:MAG: succinate dehydrogenase, hydrophobic membrane anchor protein [Steroidobacteraceae bacterium]